VLISTHKPFIILSLPCPGEEGSDRAALVGTWPPARLNHNTDEIRKAAGFLEDSIFSGEPKGFCLRAG